MILEQLENSQKETYNRFVANNPSGSFLQAWEWGDWQEKLGKPVRRFFLSDSEKPVLAAQAILSPLPFGQFYLYLPYGPVRDLALKSEDLRFFILQLQKQFPKAAFIRIEPKNIFTDLNKLGRKSANVQPGKTLILDLSEPLEELLNSMHPKTRYNIKLAKKRGVEVSCDLAVVPKYGLYVKEVLDLILETSKRQNYFTFSQSYYQGLVDFFALKNNESSVKLYIYKAVLGKELLASALMFDFGTTRTYLFGGSSNIHREVMAPHLLHFNAMLDAKNLGLRFYDFWGVETSSGETPGFARFKMGFAPQENEAQSKAIRHYAGAYDIFENKFLYHGYRMLRKLNRTVKKIGFA